jgi:hypothetical protein
MTRRAAWLAAGFAALAPAQQLKFAKRKTKERFQGAWTLVTYERRAPDGTVIYPMGQNPAGRLTYDGLGRMSAQLMRRNRPLFAGDRQGGTADEIKAAFEGYIGYCGSYEVHEKEGFVIHHVEICSFPNWIGTDQKRFFEFSDERLILRVRNTLAGQDGDNRLVWQRAV